ncbi:MAG: hypothetical protein ORN51_13540 [Akkermansiaceae bacterium]|nr:hypothetical protein [Akkermansiaceae bacterium]
MSRETVAAFPTRQASSVTPISPSSNLLCTITGPIRTGPHTWEASPDIPRGDQRMKIGIFLEAAVKKWTIPAHKA